MFRKARSSRLIKLQAIRRPTDLVLPLFLGYLLDVAGRGRLRRIDQKWACQDSNLEPGDYESLALTIELQARAIVEV